MTSGSLQKKNATKSEKKKRKPALRPLENVTIESTNAMTIPRIRIGKIQIVSLSANTHCHLVRLLSSTDRNKKSTKKLRSVKRENKRT
jgi:hypothetical protein